MSHRFMAQVMVAYIDVVLEKRATDTRLASDIIGVFACFKIMLANVTTYMDDTKPLPKEAADDFSLFRSAVANSGVRTIKHRQTIDQHVRDCIAIGRILDEEHQFVPAQLNTINRLRRALIFIQKQAEQDKAMADAIRERRFG